MSYMPYQRYQIVDKVMCPVVTENLGKNGI